MFAHDIPRYPKAAEHDAVPVGPRGIGSPHRRRARRRFPHGQLKPARARAVSGEEGPTRADEGFPWHPPEQAGRQGPRVRSRALPHLVARPCRSGRARASGNWIGTQFERWRPPDFVGVPGCRRRPGWGLHCSRKTADACGRSGRRPLDRTTGPAHCRRAARPRQGSRDRMKGSDLCRSASWYQMRLAGGNGLAPPGR